MIILYECYSCHNIGVLGSLRTMNHLQITGLASHSKHPSVSRDNGVCLLLLLLACAITHHSYVQSIVLEPCSRLIVQNNEAIDPLRWSVDGAASTGDVVCRLFSTTVTAVVRGQSPAQHVSPKSANTSP